MTRPVWYTWQHTLNPEMCDAREEECEGCKTRPLLFLTINLETAAALTAVRHLGYEAGFANGTTIAGFCEAEQSYCNDMEPVAVVEDSENQRGSHPNGEDRICH